MLEQLTALQAMMKTTGSLYSVLGVTLRRQAFIVDVRCPYQACALTDSG